MRNYSRKIGTLASYDPRTKIYILILYLLITCISWNNYSLMLNAAVALGIYALSEDTLASIFRVSKVFVALEVVTGLIFSIVISAKFGIILTVKLVFLTIIFVAVSRSIRQHELLEVFAKGFKMNAGTSKKLSIFFSFLPHYSREKKRVILAQKARGISPDEGSMLERFRKDSMLSAANLKNTYIKSTRQNDAFDMRQYTSVKRRKSISPLQFTWVDDIIILIMVLLLLVAVLMMLLF